MPRIFTAGGHVRNQVDPVDPNAAALARIQAQSEAEDQDRREKRMAAQSGPQQVDSIIRTPGTTFTSSPMVSGVNDESARLARLRADDADDAVIRAAAREESEQSNRSYDRRRRQNEMEAKSRSGEHNFDKSTERSLNLIAQGGADIPDVERLRREAMADRDTKNTTELEKAGIEGASLVAGAGAANPNGKPIEFIQNFRGRLTELDRQHEAARAPVAPVAVPGRAPVIPAPAAPGQIVTAPAPINARPVSRVSPEEQRRTNERRDRERAAIQHLMQGMSDAEIQNFVRGKP